MNFVQIISAATQRIKKYVNITPQELVPPINILTTMDVAPAINELLSRTVRKIDPETKKTVTVKPAPPNMTNDLIVKNFAVGLKKINSNSLIDDNMGAVLVIQLLKDFGGLNRGMAELSKEQKLSMVNALRNSYLYNRCAKITPQTIGEIEDQIINRGFYRDPTPPNLRCLGD